MEQSGPMLRKRVLLADDDDDFRKLVAQTLRAEGFIVTECSNGLALVETIVSQREANAPLDLIVSDVRMPGVSGFSVLEGLADWQDFCPPPMILFTAFGEPRLRTSAQEFGAFFLEKPFEMDELIDIVRDAMDQNVPALS